MCRYLPGRSGALGQGAAFFFMILTKPYKIPAACQCKSNINELGKDSTGRRQNDN